MDNELSTQEAGQNTEKKDPLRLKLIWGFSTDAISDVVNEAPDRNPGFVVAMPVPDLDDRLRAGRVDISGMADFHPASIGQVVVHVDGQCPDNACLTLRISNSARDRVRVFQHLGTEWEPLEAKDNWQMACDRHTPLHWVIGAVSTALIGTDDWDGEFSLSASILDSMDRVLTSDTVLFKTAPLLLASALDRVESVMVVKNLRSVGLRTSLSRILTELGVQLEALVVEDGAENDVWIQDAVEIGRVCVPTSKGTCQAVAILPGIRARHEGTINCEPLDRAVRDHFKSHGAIIADVATPREGTAWIDWFGNLEVSPAVTARDGRRFPFGRILTGIQPRFGMHPDVMRFLEAQRLQWPPIIVDTSWLLIGHVDEVINFVPANDAPGFRVLFPSTALAKGILEKVAQQGLGAVEVFAGQQHAMTVQELFEIDASSEENNRIQDILNEVKLSICEGLGIEESQIIELPALFRAGEAVIPNLVNSLVVNRHVFAPEPFGPRINGEDVFSKPMEKALTTLGIQVHFIDVWDYYHLNAGEIHCGTNTVRKMSQPEWWKYAQ